MRVMFGIGMRVVQAVHHAISGSTDVGRTLGNKTADVKDFFPGFAHGKHAVGSITVMKERLKKQRKIPVQHEKDEDTHNNG